MKGDNCTIHQDRKAVGYYSNGSSYGMNGCEECMKNHNNERQEDYY